MSTNMDFDLLIRNVRVARAGGNGLEDADIAIKDGKFARVAPGIAADSAAEVYDGQNRIAFPGVVDPHMHTGIYFSFLQIFSYTLLLVLFYIV